ncbi:peptidoglycan DD-metalloendopeptidase family protein [Streptomyces sp. NPDC088554]|uniref:peptidoglycan DD-metalloendopeptidase family protein n=1 Tax=Streptomyces sp. NPDC088554 TaxID=3365865 RepID=UPI00381137FE
MADLDIVATVGVDVVPLIPNFYTKLKSIVLPVADRVGKEAGERMGKAISDNIVISIPEAIVKGGQAGVRAAGRQGDNAGGAFANSLRRKLQAAFRAMPKLDVGLSDTGVDAELARIRAKLETLSNKRIGINVSAQDAEAEITRLEVKLRELGAQHPNVAVRADTVTARAALAEIRAEIAAVGGRKTVAVEVDGGFGAKLRAIVAEAQASIPDINVDADTSPARREVQEIRGELVDLADARVGIDIDAGEALAKINHLQERLAVLSLKNIDIDVRVDAAAAAAQLAALQRMADDTKVFRIKAVADTSQATNALLHLAIQAAVLTAIPIGPVLAAGLGAVAAMTVSAAAGVGSLVLVAVPAIKNIADAMKAKTAAEDDANRSTEDGARTAVQAAQRALQMAGAQASLASAHRNAARSVEQANRSVEHAERSVADAVDRAADQRTQAAETIKRAQQSLADSHRTVTRAEEALADSHRGVERAQESLTDANRAALQAQLGLIDARAEAARQLRDLEDQLAGGALDQREATLRVTEAQMELHRVLNDPRSSDLQIERAQLAADKAEQSSKEQQKSYEDLQKSAAAQQTAGVEGSDAVRAAQQRLADAQKNVRDRTEAVGDAQREVQERVLAVADAQHSVLERARDVADAQQKAARTQRDAARSVVEAQRGLADAVENAANAQVSAAESIAAAERGVESARLSSIDTTSKSISKQDEYRKALAKLSPEARDLYDAFAGPRGLKDAFLDWSAELQPEVLPLFTRGVDSAKRSLPGLTPLVEGAARGIDTLMNKSSAQMKTPFWVSFKKDLAESVQPAVEGFGVAFGNTIQGIAGIIDAFLPHMDGIARHSDRITGRFAKWGTSLKGSPDFEKFLAYVKDASPGLAEFLGDILGAALDTSKALAPLSEALFVVVGPLFETISWLSTNAPGFVQVLWGIYFAQKAIGLGMALFAGAMAVYQIGVAGATLVTSGWAVAINATGIVPVIRAIVLVVALLVAGLVYAYNNWDGFREAVDTSAGAIKKAAVWIWDNGLKPALEGIWTALKAAGDLAVWLWDKALRPSFEFIGKAAQILFTILVVAVLTPIYLAFKAAGAVGKWLWEKVLSPVFGWIGDKAKWLYDKAIKPAMRWSGDRFRELGTVLKWVWDNVISRALGWIGDKAGWLYDKAIKPAFEKIKSAVRSVSESFNSGKDSIKKAWDKIEGIAKKPVKFVIDHVYNKAIVPLWNAVSKVTGTDPLKPLDIDGYLTGGIMSGYSPGRDDRIIAVGGGEAVMRPEWTRAVGADRINAWNAAARAGGVSGVQNAISAGMPAFASGGIVGWLKDKTNAVGEFMSGAADFLNPTKVFDKATGFVKGQLKGISENPWAREMAKLPVKMLSDMKDNALSLIGFGGGAGGGSWIKPVDAAFGTPFGKSGSMWSSGKHTGLDFPAAVGTAIKAVAAGKVSMAQGGGPYGNHVMINHGGGVASLYAHMSKILTKVGAAVSQGQTIGQVGATGNTTGPHLHLEARVNGNPVDPTGFINGGSTSYKPSAGVGQWRGIVQQALSQVGQPKSYTDTTLRRMQQESGGNPNAVNKWDVNWLNGHPSVGLMQVIRPTFEAFAGKYKNTGPKQYGVSTNPMANIYSSMRYALKQYGSLPAAYNRPGGYASGGFPALGEMAWVGENGPELVRFLHPAQVYSSTESASMARTQTASVRDISASRNGGGAHLHADVRVYVGDREITDIVRTELDIHDMALAGGLTTGGR